LHLNGTADGVNDARELREKAVASVLYDSTSVLGDFRVDQLAEMRLEPRVGLFLIGAHQTRIARYIGSENGGQSTFYASRGQSGAPQPARAEWIIGSRGAF
jgi:hypothetical protein